MVGYPAHLERWHTLSRSHMWTTPTGWRSCARCKRVVRAQGFQTMEGRVLAENRRLLRFARALGFAVRPVPGDPTVRQGTEVLRSTSPASAASAGEISTG